MAFDRVFILARMARHDSARFPSRLSILARTRAETRHVSGNLAFPYSQRFALVHTRIRGAGNLSAASEEITRNPAGQP